MNIFKKVYCRGYQLVFKLALPFLPYKDPIIYKSVKDVSKIIKQEKLNKVFIVTDKNLMKINALDGLVKALNKSKIQYYIYENSCINPTSDLVYQALDCYKDNECDCILAFGGGSPIDLAKALGCLIVNPNKKLSTFKGLMKVKHKLPTLIAIPTTAGTGSEVTVTSVIIDSETRHKYTINDFNLIPKYAILDANLISTLPRFIASTTGLDALTHAIEAYIGKTTTKQTREYSLEAIKLIFENIKDSSNHKSKKAQENMLLASHLAGKAFTRSYVGYVHAISHSLSGEYNLAHGYTNALLLPIVLEQYNGSIYKKLKKIAIYLGVASKKDNKKEAALKIIDMIKEINNEFGIPNKVEALKKEDIDKLVLHADKEANPLYPVPKLFDKKELRKIYEIILSDK